jgi:Asp-tRNA(Asn)/Glu-tRNA(Gln) amidotransferase A subunit family amidase
VNITIPHLNWLSLAHGIKISTEYALEWDLIHSTKLKDLEPNTRLFLAIATSLSALEVISADRLRSWAFNYTVSLFEHERLSAIVTPTVGFLAPELEDASLSHGVSDTTLVMKVMKHMFLANFIGLPAYSVPVGYDIHPKTGVTLPIGLQLIGAHWTEHVLLRLAACIEKDISSPITQLKSSDVNSLHRHRGVNHSGKMFFVNALEEAYKEKTSAHQ